MPFGLWARIGIGNHVLDGVHVCRGMGNLGERVTHCKGLSAETAESIDLPLGCGLGWAEGSTSSIVFTRWRQCTQFQSYLPGGANVPRWESTFGAT